MKNLFIFFSVALMTTASFAEENSTTTELIVYPKVHVYCDGEYAGYFYDIGYSDEDIEEMSSAMCQ